MRILFRTIKAIWANYTKREALYLTIAYGAMLVRNRIFRTRNQAKVLNFTVEFPFRPVFFGMVSEIFFHGVYATVPKKAVRILDCGANIGVSALYFSWRCPGARISSFEPNPEALPFLKKNISLNGLSNVEIMPFALGKKEGSIELYQGSVEGSSTASTMRAVLSREDGARKIAVPLKRLSSFINESIDFLKIDVEGAEGEILEDLAETGKLSLVKQIALEHHFDGVHKTYPLEKLLNLLTKGGFSLKVIRSSEGLGKNSKKNMDIHLVYGTRIENI